MLIPVQGYDYCPTSTGDQEIQSPQEQRWDQISERVYCSVEWKSLYKGIHADVIVYIFAHLHTTLLTEDNFLGIYSLQATKELVKPNTWFKF